MQTMSYDPTARVPGQHARSIVRRMRLRTLVALGVLAVATALLGRVFGIHDVRFLGAEIALLAAITEIEGILLWRRHPSLFSHWQLTCYCRCLTALPSVKAQGVDFARPAVPYFEADA